MSGPRRFGPMQEQRGGTHSFSSAGRGLPFVGERPLHSREGVHAEPEPLPQRPARRSARVKVESVLALAFSLLQEPEESDAAEYREDSVLSNTEEGVPEDLNQDTLSQNPDIHSPGRGGAFNKLPRWNRSFQKLALVTGEEKLCIVEKPYKCAECGKTFKLYSRLLKHMQTHRRGNMFECIACGKSFNRRANLVVHQRVHTGERPYKCKQCEKTFSHSSNLIAHHKTHAKKVFSCTTCKKKFSGSTALFHHQRVHVDEKPYRCFKCGNSFCLCSSFVRHQRIHLREEPSEYTADANNSECTSLHHKEEQGCGAGEPEKDGFNLVLEELKKMRENTDVLLLNQQSQLQVLQEIQKQLNILLSGDDLINSNVYTLGLLLGRQLAAATSFFAPS